MPTSKIDLKDLTKLGKSSKSERKLEAFPNHAPGEITVTLNCTEFTCLCPLTGQPDFAEIEITYIPDQFVVESKSMKLYLETFRNTGVFHEHLAVDIGKDFIKYIKPLSLDVIVKFNIRGGIAISAKYHWDQEAKTNDD
jgi:7-cyano-7-deazaguanine reductase